MKRIITSILLCAILCAAILGLTSCGKTLIDAGKYQDENGQIIEVAYEQIIQTQDIEDSDGKLVLVCDYFIDNGKITLTVDKVEVLGEGLEDYLEAMQAYYKDGRPQTFTFEEIDGGFKMGGTTFKKI
ncbi:MAG: hypothetical protein IJE25_06840 [Clostridia bacterium]|nr:hypothetical protein [Clostridia bacterium]